MTTRWDETWRVLLEWTDSPSQSERLAAQILLHEGYGNLDPSHPNGGKDSGKDAVCYKSNQKCVMAVYFPRGQQKFNNIKKKFLHDLKGVQPNSADALIFVTNQELRLAEREKLKNAAGNVHIELFHLERITAILDKPEMFSVRKQFLGIDYDEMPLVVSLGGEGGKALSSGGGGGGAFGLGAHGGDGGPGGNVVTLDGQPGDVPGAGGGGGGAMGDGAIGGEGGGGGEIVTALLRLDELFAEHQQVLEIKVGRGGEGGKNEDGEDGEETTVSLLKADGSKNELLRANGGNGGQMPKQTQLPSENSSAGKIWISSALIANYAEIRDGLLFTLGCGWDFCTLHNFPSILCGYFIFVVELSKARIGTRYELLVKIINEESLAVGETLLVIENHSSSKVIRQNKVVPFQVEVAQPGIWSVQVLMGNLELVRQHFEVC